MKHLTVLIAIMITGCGANKRTLPTFRKLGDAPAHNHAPIAVLVLSNEGATSPEFAASGLQRRVKISIIKNWSGLAIVPDDFSRARGASILRGDKTHHADKLIELLETKKPWEWESANVTFFADTMSFRGNWKKQVWSHKSLYPYHKMVEMHKAIDDIFSAEMTYKK